MSATPEDLEALGLYDPSAADAQDRLALLQYLLGKGLGLDEMATAEREDRLQALVVEGLMRPRGGRMTLAEAAERVRVSPEMCLRVWRALGFADPDPDEEAFSEEDLGILSLLPMTARLGLDVEEVLHTARVIGSSLARIAEAEVLMLRENVEAPLRAAGAGDFVVARTLAQLVTDLMPRISSLVDGVHRQHLEIAAHQQIFVDLQAGYLAVDVVVGFADLVGFTAWSSKLPPGELAAAMADYEQRVSDIVAGNGGRLVKLIGDGAMFVASDLDAGCEIALSLVEVFSWDPVIPPLRVGLAVGEAVRREGDYYGAVVNLASRVVDVAFPRAVLATKTLADRLGASEDHPHFLAKRVGAHRLKGIGTEQLYVVRRERRARERA